MLHPEPLGYQGVPDFALSGRCNKNCNKFKRTYKKAEPQDCGSAFL